MSIKKLFLQFLVFNMKWMTRYFGFIARPFIMWYAQREIIACGFRSSEDKNVYIIYPKEHERRSNYLLYKKIKDKWKQVSFSNVHNFSKNLIEQKIILNTCIGEIYKIKAQDFVLNKFVSSPSIHIKKMTKIENNLLNVNTHTQNLIFFSWEKAKEKKTMIYFLLIEDVTNCNGLFCIYTRETTWQFPNISGTSLVFGNFYYNQLIKKHKYKAKLLLVDFDGWVSNMAIKEFDV